MEHMELIPMEADYKEELKRAYLKPLRRNVALLSCFLAFIPLLIVYLAISQGNYFILLFLLLFGYFYLFLLHKFRQVKRHYYEDAQLGYIVKEQTIVTKVFPTPVGINIYWLSSEDIKTFTPDPYRHFREGERVTIYYLKHSKEYLAYSL